MQKAVLFNIDEKKDDQERIEMAMTPEERLFLVLDLMDLSIALSPEKSLPSKDDQIEWIELKFKNTKPDKENG